jgi:hypothetical protein
MARGERTALSLVVAALVIWGLAFVWLNRQTIDGATYFLVFDDALIAMTYARNLVGGFGLNWARFGEPVEGFTNPLWVAAMVAIEILPLAQTVKPLVVLLLSLALLAANVVVIRLIVVRHFGFGPGWWLPAAVATAAYFPLNLWALMGMESGAQALVTSLVVLLALDALRAERLRLDPLCATLAAGLLLRMDMALLGVAVMPFLAVRFGVSRANIAEWLGGAALALAPIGLYIAFRFAYFGEFWPNTYDLKMTGVPAEARMLRGWLVALEAFAWTAWFWGPVLLASLALARRHAPFALGASVVTLRLLYSVFIGGDAYEDALRHGPNRFVAPVLPIVFVLASGLLNLLLAGRSLRMPTAMQACAALALTLLSPFLPGPEADRRVALLLQVERSPHQLLHMRTLAELLALRRETGNDPHTRVATMWAGMPGYYTDWLLVDIYGYNDRAIARGPDRWNITTANARDWMPGHNKSNLAYTIRAHRPDWFLHMFSPAPRAERLLLDNGYRLAPNGHWRRAPEPEPPRPATPPEVVG